MVVLVQLVRMSHCDCEGRESESHTPPQWSRIPTGRGDGLRNHTVWVQIPPRLPFINDENTAVSLCLVGKCDAYIRKCVHFVPNIVEPPQT